MANNKVKFGLSRVHYAMVTETESDGVVTSSYGTLKPLAGAVSLRLYQPVRSRFSEHITLITSYRTVKAVSTVLSKWLV